MKMIGTQQGTNEWHAHRAQYFNASECAAMLGISPYKTRDELLREKATGLVPEVDDATQRRFGEGHRVEAFSRSIAEEKLGEELYPCVGILEGTKLSASFDGLTMDGITVWECKTMNTTLHRVFTDNLPLPEHYYAQLEQQLLVSGADKAVFTAAAFDDNGTLREWGERHYTSSPELRQRILDGWAQFEKDLAAYQAQPLPPPKPTGKAPESLPALHIQATGKVLASNLDTFKQQAFAVLDSINRDLQTDDDFANADATIKWCKQIEQKLDATKQHVLSQTVDIEAVFRTIDEVAEYTRKIRLELDKLTKAQKENRKLELVNTGVEAIIAHLVVCNETLGEFQIPLRGNPMTEISAAIKGLRSLASMQDAINTKVAEWKIAIDADTRRVQANSALLAEHAAHMYLFADANKMVLEKEPDDLHNLITARIADAERAERERQEQERTEHANPHVQKLAELYAHPENSRNSNHLTDVDDTHVAHIADHSAHILNMVPPDNDTLIKLGDITAAIAPMFITAEGLRRLGVPPHATDKSVKLYRERDLVPIMRTLSRYLDQQANAMQHAMFDKYQKQAA